MHPLPAGRHPVPRKYFRKYLPDRDTVRSSRLAKPFGSWLHQPNLWCLNRRSVSGAVAIGLFCGLIPGPLQMLGALLLAIPLRKNIPVALIVTLYTNPLTIVPLYVIAFEYARLLLGLDPAAAGITPFAFDWADWRAADGRREVGGAARRGRGGRTLRGGA